MNNDLLLKTSQSLHDDATSIISDIKFTELFQKLGKVVFVGSYFLNLLYRRDIDVFVIDSNCNADKAHELTKHLIDLNIFQTVAFADWTLIEPANHLKGFYWKLIYYYQGNPWKFDIWYTSQEVTSIPKSLQIKSILIQHPEARLKILTLKQKYYNGNTYVEGMNGFKIYETVLGKID